MVLSKKIDNRSSHTGAGTSRIGAGACAGISHIFKKRKMSYLSSFSESLTSENLRVFAFANRGGPLHRMLTTRNHEVDNLYRTENMTMLNHLNRLVTQRDKRKRKTNVNNNEKEMDEFNGLGVINVNGENIDLNKVWSSGDDFFESELNKMTYGKVSEEELLGVMSSLVGRWGSHRKRRRYVNAAILADVLPDGWEILLSLRPRSRQPILYCRRFVSPSGVHFHSCKEVAFHLKYQFDSPPHEVAMLQIEYGQVDVESGALIPISSPPASNVDLLETNNNEEEDFEGLHVIDVNGKQINLKSIASVADDMFESAVNNMTARMATEADFLGVLYHLDGCWGSKRKRKKYVDASVFADVLPVGWEILLSLRPRAQQPSLYCRRFVSPSGVHFKTCKKVAAYLKSQLVAEDANPMQIDNHCQVDIESRALVPVSSPHPASNVDLLETNDLRNVPLYHLVECEYCKSPFTSMGELEYHLQKVHGNTIRRSDKDTLTRKLTTPRGLLTSVIKKEVDPLEDTSTSPDVPIGFPINGEGSSSFPEPLNDPKKSSEGEGKLKTRCMWCLTVFFREPVNAETLVSSSGFICPKCKEDAACRFANALSELTQHVK